MDRIKKIKGKDLRNFLVISVVFFFLLKEISATTLGISPGKLNFRNVLRDGYAERVITITTNSQKKTEVWVKTRGDIKDWLNFSELNFNVSRDEPHRLKVEVRPPKDIPNGNYTGFISISWEELGKSIKGHAVGIVKPHLDVYVEVEVTDIEVVKCGAFDFDVDSVEKGDDIVFKVKVSNNGNIRLKPKINIDIWDQEQLNIIKSKEFTGEEILPTTSKELVFRINSKDLDFGQYWADFAVLDCYASQTLTFDVLRPGALRAEGRLLGIVNKRFAIEGETVPIKVKFKNEGEKEVEARFKGKVSLGERVVQILESEKLKVPVGDIEVFNFFFTPKKEGKYIISGRVFYNGKRTFEASSILEVYSKKFRWSKIIVPLVYAFLIILIGFLFYKIRREKRKYYSRLKKLKIKKLK